MKISHSTYGGMRPAVDPHLLGETEAQLAQNCVLDSGGLWPLRAPSRVQTISLTSCQSLYRYLANDTGYWLASADLLHFARSPEADQTYERLFFAGKNEVRFLANDNLSTPPDLDTDYYKAGVPAPTSAHTLSGYTGSGTGFKAYFYRFLNRCGDYGSNSPPVVIEDYTSGRMSHSGIESAPAGRGIDRIELFKANEDDTGESEFQFVAEAWFFSTSQSYAVGDYVVYSGALYECTTAHSAGAWNASNFTAGEAVADDDLGAVCDSVGWYPPPDGLKGLIVLPNGSLAGVVGNWLCFSEPYKPWAWPVGYRKSLANEAVGVSNFGSTVVVATDGVPAVFYGQHPDSMAPGDPANFMLCAAPATIAPWNDAVYFRGVDGMARVSLSGVVNATDAIIGKRLWQSTYAPSVGCFYGDRYYGFHASGGVIIDFALGTMRTTTVRAYACHVASDDGCLYLVCDDPDAVNPDAPPEDMPLCIKLWEGSTVNYLYYTWRGRLEMLDYETNPAYGMLVLNSQFYDDVAALLDLSSLNAAIFAGDIGGALRSSSMRSRTLRGDLLYRLEGFSFSNAVAYKVYAAGVVKSFRVLTRKENVFTLKAGFTTRQLEVEISGYVPVSRDGVATSAEELMGLLNSSD